MDSKVTDDSVNVVGGKIERRGKILCSVGKCSAGTRVSNCSCDVVTFLSI